MKIVLAVPTITERGDSWEKTGSVWRRRTCQPIVVEPSWRKGSWAVGLNEVWEKHPDADVMVCGSDDIFPENDYWLPACEEWLEQGKSPVPHMKDPRFEIQGGVITDTPRSAGDQSHMTNFPILRGDWLRFVFPLDPRMHYFSDNVIADRLHAHGVETVYAPDFVVVHTWDERGRGAGMGSEDIRMVHDRQLYRSAT